MQLSIEEKSTEEDCLSDEYDSVEEDVFSEPSSTEETVTSFGGLQLHSSKSLQKEASERWDAGGCSGLDSGTITVLEFSQDQNSKSVYYTLPQYYNNNTLRVLLLRELLLVSHQ